MNNLIKEMEDYAKINKVPIIEKDSINYIINYIKENNVKTVLEIGSAICYSTILMANVTDKVTTIERDKERYKVALTNIDKAHLNDKITIINDDALNITLNEKYDLIFIDGAKAQNKKFVDHYKNNLKENGSIIIDNLAFHGLVGKSESITSRNLRSLVRKIEAFLDYLDEQTEFKVEKVSVGDTLVILRR